MSVNVHTPAPGSPGAPSRKPRVVWFIASAWVLGGLLGVLLVGLKKGGFLTLSDVGDLPQLAHVQQLLEPLDACGMEYAARDKRGHRDHFEYVFVEPCSDPLGRVLVKVRDAWGRSGVGFELTRSSRTDPWKVLVEKDEVPFDRLRAALDEMAPQIAREYAALKAAQDASEQRDRQAQEDQKAADQARKERAESSYPD